MGQEAVSQASFGSKSAMEISAVARNSPGLPAATLLHQQRVEKRAARSFRTSSPGLPAATLCHQQRVEKRAARSFRTSSSPGLPAATLCHHKLGIFEEECAARSLLRMTACNDGVQ